jgi:hypothetical protein
MFRGLWQVGSSIAARRTGLGSVTRMASPCLLTASGGTVCGGRRLSRTWALLLLPVFAFSKKCCLKTSSWWSYSGAPSEARSLPLCTRAGFEADQHRKRIRSRFGLPNISLFKRACAQAAGAPYRKRFLCQLVLWFSPSVCVYPGCRFGPVGIKAPAF